MRASVLFLLLCLCCVCWPCQSCTTGGGAPAVSGSPSPAPVSPQAAAPGGLALPAPAELHASLGDSAGTRRVSFVENDLVKDGVDFSDTLPHNRIDDGNPPKLDLDPDWPAGGGNALADLAYCLYHFSVPGYDRNPQLRVDWSNGPEYANQWMVGVANWDENRWDWYVGTTTGRIELGDLSPYLDFSSNMIVVLACMGTDPCILYGLRLGGLPPDAALVATPNEGGVPFGVNFDASGSVPGEGEITDYDWDFNGDGVYDRNTGTTPTTIWFYYQNGEFHPRVQVTNSLNARNTVSVMVNAVGDWAHTWHGPSSCEINDTLVDDDHYIYATGRTWDEDTNSHAVLLMRISPTGIIRWARNWDDTGTETGLALEFADDGTIIVAGRWQDTGASDILLMKWTKSGSVLWSERYGGESTDELAELLVDGNDIYLCGDTISTVAPATYGYDYFALKCGGDGVAHWTRARDLGETSNYATAMTFKGDVLTGNSGLIIVGTAEVTGGTSGWMVEYDLDGGFTRARELGDPPWLVAPGAVDYFRNPVTFESRYYVGGQLLEEERAFFHSSTGNGTCKYGTRVMAVNPVTVNAMVSGHEDGILMAGWMDMAVGDQATLWQFETTEGALVFRNNWEGAEASDRAYFECLALTEYGALLGGSVFGAKGDFVGPDNADGGFSVDWFDAPGEATSPVWLYNTIVSGQTELVTKDLTDHEDQGGPQCALLVHRRM